MGDEANIKNGVPTVSVHGPVQWLTGLEGQMTVALVKLVLMPNLCLILG
jgi:hypothetical protein